MLLQKIPQVTITPNTVVREWPCTDNIISVSLRRSAFSIVWTSVSWRSVPESEWISCAVRRACFSIIETLSILSPSATAFTPTARFSTVTNSWAKYSSASKGQFTHTMPTRLNSTQLLSQAIKQRVVCAQRRDVTMLMTSLYCRPQSRQLSWVASLV